MVKMKIYLVVMLLWGSYAYCNTASRSTLTFQRLQEVADDFVSENSKEENFHQKEVYLRGFLFKSEKGQWILSSEPNLKTCCIGSSKKVLSQVLLEGHFQDSFVNEAVTLQGLLLIDPQRDRDGNLVQMYILKNAEITEKNPKTIPWTSLGFIAIGLLVGGLVFKNRKKIF
jgi:hypothetical protein